MIAMVMKKRVLIFTEGGSQIGLGHISRCSSLYDELEDRDVEVKFIINGDATNLEVVQNKNVEIVNWLSAEFLNLYINDNDYCIVDSYLADQKLYEVISEKSCKCLFIDDNGRIEYPDGIVVNPSLNTDSIRYPKIDKNYLQGPVYIILRKAFINSKRFINTEVKEVLITLGGSDVSNLTPTILNALCKSYPEFFFNIVIGNAFNNIDEIESIESANIKLLYNLNANNMKEIMVKSDIAITAAGQTIYELLATQTPFIPIKIVDNQQNNMMGLKKYNLIENVLNYRSPFFIKDLKAQFEELLDYNRRTEISASYGKIVDGLGSKRIVNSLLGFAATKEEVFLRIVKSEDIRDVFQLSNEDYVRQFSIHKNKIDWKDHVVWFDSILKSDDKVFYVVTDCTEKFLGQIRYTIENKSAIVSISLCQSITGKGLSHKLLFESIKRISEERKGLDGIIAFVSDENIASRKLFERVNFVLCDENDSMLKYVYSLKRE